MYLLSFPRYLNCRKRRACRLKLSSLPVGFCHKNQNLASFHRHFFSPIMRPVGTLRVYGRLSEEAANDINRSRRRKLVVIGFVLFAILIAAALISVSVGILVFGRKRRSNDNGNANAAAGGPISTSNYSKEIDMACGQTLYPQLCMSTLATYPGVQQAVREPKDLAHITLNVTMDRVQRAYQGLAHNWDKEDQERIAYQDCVELLEDTIYHLNASMAKIRTMSMNPKSSMADVSTWLSAALTNQDTCRDGFQELIIAPSPANISSNIKDEIEQESKKLSELVSNSLAMFQILFGGSDINGLPQTNNFTVVQPPMQNRRRLLADDQMNTDHGPDQEFYEHYGLINDQDAGLQEFPRWLLPRDRRLLQMPAAGLNADAVVAKDGSGNYTSVADAVMEAPSKLSKYKRYIIYVKAGVYDETVTVPRKKTYLMFVGDGKGKTVIVFGKNVKDGSTTFHSATFAASGEGFIARDITFLNNAGPEKEQAVALRVGADLSAIYHCSIIGYQDTLYAHSLRQFYRECDIYGTVDFIFGNAAVVLQKCNIYPRKPMANQRNTITAQGRKDPNQNTGISIHNCRVTAANDLAPVKASYPTYLGRPWKLYSRTVYMQTYLDDLINSAGWLEWSGDFALKTLYYGEYMNVGPGAGLDGRVTWPGYNVIKTANEANPFTVDKFISGSRWLSSTGIPYTSGLLV